jgi:hypothetical protein
MRTHQAPDPTRRGAVTTIPQPRPHLAIAFDGARRRCQDARRIWSTRSSSVQGPTGPAGHAAQRPRAAARRRWSVRRPTRGRHVPGHTACPWRARWPGSSSRPPGRERAAGLKPSTLLPQELNCHGRRAQLCAQAAQLTVMVSERVCFHRLLASSEERLTPRRETGGGEPELT